MEYEKVKGIVDAVQHVYQVCTTIFDGLRNPRADAGYIHADEEYLRKNHLEDAAALHAKFSKFKNSIRSVHDKFDSNLGTHNATTVLEAIPTCYDRILREWKNVSLEFDAEQINGQQMNGAVAQVEASIVTVILHAMQDVFQSLKQTTDRNQHFEKCASQFYAVASQFYADEAYTIRIKPMLHYNPDMIIGLLDIQGAIVNWRAWRQDRTSLQPTKKIKIMQTIVRICIFSQPEIFNKEDGLDTDIRERLNESPQLVRFDAHVSPITSKLAQLHQMTNKCIC